MAVHESRTGALVRVPMSWEEYEALEPDGRHEYIEGCLVVNPRPTLRHQKALLRLARVLEDAAEPGYQVYVEGAWKPGLEEWAPDIMVCPQTEAVRFSGIPELVVEVLSGDPARDLVMKSQRYAVAGLLRYWVADPEQLMITAFELRDGEFAQVDSAGADDEVSLDFGVGTVTFTLRHLLADR
jgi:Uma2 family endonuclease